MWLNTQQISAKMEFKFAIVGGHDLALSDDEGLSSQLCEQALKMELRRQHKLNFAVWKGDTASQFQGFLIDLVSELQPRRDDYLVRMDILRRLSLALDYMSSFRGATISTFGSFESNLYTRWADLDLSLELPNRIALLGPINKGLKVKALKSLLRTLIGRAEACNEKFIPYPRVPLITFEDSRHNISCDISVNNGVAVLKSRLLGWVGEIDSRCRDLIFLVKCWAKAHCINDPKTGTLNSFTLCLLVVFHLQTRSPPVLPPLSAVLAEDIARQLSDPQNSIEEVLKGCWNKIQPFIVQKFGAQNKSSVAELFCTFFNQFSSVTELWSHGLAVCTFTGAWGDRTSTCGKWRSRGYVMAVEDPFDRAENCARSVQESSFLVILQAFASTADTLCLPVPDRGLSLLLEALFHWPVGTQNMGLQAWLSKVYSKERKPKTVQVKKSTKERSTAVISASGYRERGSVSHASNVTTLCDSNITDAEILPRRNDSIQLSKSKYHPRDTSVLSSFLSSEVTIPLRMDLKDWMEGDLLAGMEETAEPTPIQKPARTGIETVKPIQKPSSSARTEIETVKPKGDTTQSEICTLRNTAPIKFNDSTRQREMVFQKGWKTTGQQHQPGAKVWGPKTREKEGSYVRAVTGVPSLVEGLERRRVTVAEANGRSLIK